MVVLLVIYCIMDSMTLIVGLRKDDGKLLMTLCAVHVAEDDSVQWQDGGVMITV